LPDYIGDNGGVDAIRKKGVIAATEAKAKAHFMNFKQNFLFEMCPPFKPALGSVSLASGAKSFWHGSHAEYTILICQSGYPLDEPLIVGAIGADKWLEDAAIKAYFVRCSIATRHDKDGFYNYCKELGYCVEDIEHWMAENDLASAADARALLTLLTVSADKLQAKKEATWAANAKLKEEKAMPISLKLAA
jgi:hypothetical protein